MKSREMDRRSMAVAATEAAVDITVLAEGISMFPMNMVILGLNRIPTSKRNTTESHLRNIRYSTSKCSEKKINIQALAPKIHPIQLSLQWISTNAVRICIDR